MFSHFFEQFNLNIFSREYLEFYVEILSLYKRILKINYFQSTLIESVRQVFSKVDFNFEILGLVNCCIKSLLGFAGRNKIYLNVKQFLMFHEVVHVVLISNTNDLNSSCPVVKNIVNKKSLENLTNLLELGLKT